MVPSNEGSDPTNGGPGSRFLSTVTMEKDGCKRSQGKGPQTAPLPAPCWVGLRATANCKTPLPHSSEGLLETIETVSTLLQLLLCGFIHLFPKLLVSRGQMGFSKRRETLLKKWCRFWELFAHTQPPWMASAQDTEGRAAVFLPPSLSLQPLQQQHFAPKLCQTHPKSLSLPTEDLKQQHAGKKQFPLRPRAALLLVRSFNHGQITWPFVFPEATEERMPLETEYLGPGDGKAQGGH